MIEKFTSFSSKKSNNSKPLCPGISMSNKTKSGWNFLIAFTPSGKFSHSATTVICGQYSCKSKANETRARFSSSIIIAFIKI